MTTADLPSAGYPSVHAAALAAWDAGLCPVQASTTGKKKPQGEWKEWQTRRPQRLRVDEWFADGWPGLGIICGEVSGNLEMFEFEGAAIRAGLWTAFCDACEAAGLSHVVHRVVHGYSEHTPSDGVHMFLKVSDGPALSNTKLALRADGTTMIETRGEGGFVIVAPSHGSVHPTGRPWVAAFGSFDRIATVTAAERDALYAVARSLDATPAAPERPTAPTQVYQVRADGESWMDDLTAQLRSDPWHTVLGRYGWTHSHTAQGVDYWVRPGKDVSEGHGATTNALGTDRLIVFTSNPGTAHLEAWSGTGPARSYDRLDVIAAYDHGGRRIDAARHLAQRDIKPTRSAPPPHVDPDTGEIRTSLLDDEFWTARPALTHIRTAARARLVAPAAVLGCVLARVAAFTPPSTCLPALIGSYAPLSLYIALRGQSGAGKSSPVSCANDLLPGVPHGCIGPLGLGSGEGLVEAYMDLVEDTDGDGKKRRTKQQSRYGALFTLDEGQALAEMSNRKGSTILPVLRTAWSGGDPGQANASVETRRSLRPNSYHVGLISLWQDGAAGQLLADVDGGTPQRFVWLSTGDPEASVDAPPWPGPLEWDRPSPYMMDGKWLHAPLEVDGVISNEVVAARVSDLRGETESDPLDSHRRLNKLKVAGVLAVLDNRSDVTLDDWALAERIMASSDATRNWIIWVNRQTAADREKASAIRVAERELLVEDAAAKRAMEVALRAVERVAAKQETFTRRQVVTAITSRDRARVNVDEALEKAEQKGLVRRLEDGSWTAKACG